MVVDRVGVSIDVAMGGNANDGSYFVASADQIATIFNAHLRINVNSLLLAEGPMIKFASGYGIGGMIHNGIAGDGIVNIGVPSPAAIPKLVKTQTLTEKHEILGFLTFFSRDWADWVRSTPHVDVGVPVISDDTLFLPVKCWLHGLLKVAVNK
jgi:hypothetical protein